MTPPTSPAAPRIVVLGSLNMDLVLRVPHMPQPGETLLAHGMAHIPGGKGGNQAVSCARQGAATTLLSCTGRDAHGDTLLAALAQDGIDTRHIARHPSEGTGLAAISVDDSGQNQIIVVPGANQHLDVPEALLAPLLAGSAYVVLQFETPLAQVDRAIRVARAQGCRVALNPSPMQALPAHWWPAIDLLVVNETEAAQLLGSPIASPAQAAAAAQQLRARGAAQVVITLGADGALAADAQGARLHQAARVQAVDTTAAGDTFLGALVTQLAQGQGLDGATQWAIRAAGLCVTRAGAQPSIPTRAEVDAHTQATAWSPL
ncbi:ribokinase [Comamonas humi]